MVVLLVLGARSTRWWPTRSPRPRSRSWRPADRPGRGVPRRRGGRPGHAARILAASCWAAATRCSTCSTSGHSRSSWGSAGARPRRPAGRGWHRRGLGRTGGQDVRTSGLEIPLRSRRSRCPIRILTRSVVAQIDGNTYFLQALQDRSTEVATLNALLTVLVVGGLLVSSCRWASARSTRGVPWCPIRESLGGPADGAAAPARVRRRRQPRAPDAAHGHPLRPWSTSSDTRDRPVAGPRRRSRTSTRRSAHLTALVDDLLLLARSDSGAVTLERCRWTSATSRRMPPPRRPGRRESWRHGPGGPGARDARRATRRACASSSRSSWTTRSATALAEARST